MSLVVVGSIALDSIETPKGKIEKSLGGSAIYASLAASYFGPAYIVGVVGEDFPEEAIHLLKEHNINLEGLETKLGKTFRWKGVYNNWNQAETLKTELNVFADFSPSLPDSYRKCNSLLLANIHPELQGKVLKQMKSYRWVACDTMNYWINLCPEELTKVIHKVDILFINEDEIRQYTGIDNIFKAARMILKSKVQVVVVKRGEYGSVAILPDDLFFSPAYPLEEIFDPTGAGDSFAGAFMSYLASQSSLDKNTIHSAIRYGTVLAAKCVSDFGVRGLIHQDFSDLQKMVNQLESWT